jgi:predicted GNAT superfamily acetyltransferase
VKNILADNSLPAATDVQSISLPANLNDIKTKDRAAAGRVQAHARGEFQKLFLQGYIATSLEPRGATTDYILEPAASVAGLRLPEYRPEEFED